jgi:5'-deoxynucleotidase YfbR-like HD superfamily hydrolase
MNLLFLNLKVIIFKQILISYFKIAAQEISELWLEYEENSSPEAKIVKDLDKVYSI